MTPAAQINAPIYDSSLDAGRRVGDPFSDPQLISLHEIIQAVARQNDPRATLSLIAEKARALTGATSAAVMLLDPTRALLDFVAVAGRDAEEIVGQTVHVEDALAGPTALTGEIYVAHNPTESRPLLATLDPELGRGWGVRSTAVVPIYVSGRPAGALAAINREDNGAFSGGDILRLQVLANTAALALGTDALRREAGQKQRERDILYEAARTTASSLNVQDVLSSVLLTLSDALEMTAGAVFLLNDERTRLYIGADCGLDGDDRDRQMSADSGLAAHVLSSSLPLRLEDALASPFADDLPFPDARALLVAPIVSRGIPEGLIVVASRQTSAFGHEDQQIVQAVAASAAVALENAWLYEDATRRAEEATALYELSQSVGATLELDRVLHFVADSVLALLHVDKFALFLFDERARCLRVKIARNIRRETVQSMTPRPGEGIAGWVLEFETPTAVQDVAADHRNRSYPIDGEGVTSLVSVPLQSREQVIGVLHAMSSRRRLFTVGEMELLYTIANQVGAAIANARMYEEARQKSDELRKSVRRIARALGTTGDSQTAAQLIADLAMETTGADRSILWVLDAGGQLIPRAASNFRAALSVTGEETRTDATAAWIARRARSLAFADFAAEPRFALAPALSRERASGFLGVPLRLGSDVLGVLEVFTKEPRRFHADEMRLLITLASQASVALQNAILVEQAGRRVADLDALDNLSARLARAELPELLALVSDALRADGGVLRRPDGPELRFGADDLPADAHRLDVPLAEGTLSVSRPPSSPAFDSHDRRLLATAANLLALKVASPVGE